MVRLNKLALSLTLCSSALVAVACGGTDGAEVGQKDNGVPAGLFDDGSTLSPGNTQAACVSSVAAAKLDKVNLVFMYDRSGSMGDLNNDPPFDPNVKWIPVGKGMKSFFTDSGSQGLNASLNFFPLGGDVAQNCTAPYATPKVPLSPLTSSATFTSAIDTTTPKGGTPTLPALNGAITYAKKVAAERPDEKAVIVLVTDGEPGFMINGKFEPGCPGNTIDGVAAAAQGAFKGSPSIPTYVIGVGPSLDNLNRIAAAGGTQSAQMVSVADPAATANQFQQTLEKIRGAVLSCDFGLPPAPDGKALDIEAVNVAFVSGGKEQVLSYSKDCTGGTGWRYDNRTAPTKIELCPATCEAARQDADGKLTLAMGCKTKGDLR